MLESLTLSHSSGATAEIYRQGAHVASWRTADGADVLFMSRESLLEPGVPIRGGIPLVFPQFSDRGPLPKHGFARTSEWLLAEQGTDPAGAAFALLRLSDSDDTLAIWPHPFEAELRVTLDAVLTTALRVRNSGKDPFRFTSALHTYFRVGDIYEVTVDGLQGSSYLGVRPGNDATPAPAMPLRFERETDGVYAGVGRRLAIRDDALGRMIEIDTTGFEDAVVWNPWVERSRQIEDLGDDEYLHFLCVEPANIAVPTELEPGEEWIGTQTLRVVPAT